MKIIIIQDPGLLATGGNLVEKVNSYHNLVTSSIYTALLELGNEVDIYDANPYLENKLSRNRPDLVFNTSIKRLYNSVDAYAPEILDKLNIPFIGPSAISCNTAYDKQKSLEVLKKTGITTNRFITFININEINIPESFQYPLFVKPQKGGCSLGITDQSMIHSKLQAVDLIRHAMQSNNGPVIVEEFLPGREFTVGVIENTPPTIFNILEFIYKDGELPFRSQSRKMSENEMEDAACLAILKESERMAIETLAIKAYKALGCRDYARIDIRENRIGIPTIIEVNAIPNLEPETSSFGLMAKYSGIPFGELIETIVKTAQKRYDFQ